MSFFRIRPENLETFTIVTNPSRQFSSSSVTGITGSVHVFPRRSLREKDVVTPSTFTDIPFVATGPEAYLRDLSAKLRASPKTSIHTEVVGYLDQVNNQITSARKQKVLNIARITPPVTFGSGTLKKLAVKNTLMPYYRHAYTNCNWAYTNYHTLNFFTSSKVTNGTAILYPNYSATSGGTYASGSYVVTGGFTFEFHINPRYTTTTPNEHFTAGTIMHLSSCYAVSLITGSSRDQNGIPNAYRLMLQLSHSADIPPSLATTGTYPKNLVFLSDDNCLKKNNWHHVAITWGTQAVDSGYGVFVVDGSVAGEFLIPSASVAPRAFSTYNPDVLVIGNYFEGKNSSPTQSTANFFASEPATRDGVRQLTAQTGIDKPASISFRHPLKAEIHDIIIRDEFVSDHYFQEELYKVGPETMDGIKFYLPPFFTGDSPERTSAGGYGGVFYTPFTAEEDTTVTPFNAVMAFGVSGHDINLENFVQDFAQNQWPRLFDLTASIQSTAGVTTANTVLYDQAAVRKRNLTILPSDDGTFYPNFNLIPRASSDLDLCVDDLGEVDYSLISLNEMVPYASHVIDSITAESGSMFDAVVGPTPEDPTKATGEALTMVQRTRDVSSNEIVLFDISNLYFGNKIKPGTFEIYDSNLSGSGDAVSIRLKDDGYGNLYRGDCLTSQSHWNSVGNVFYNEGIVLIKSPHLAFFGKEQYVVSFKGEHNIHTLKMMAFAPANTLNSSSNPNYHIVSASNHAWEQHGEKFVYLSQMNWHDDNFNIIAKTVFAQPIQKRTGDKFAIRAKLDF